MLYLVFITTVHHNNHQRSLKFGGHSGTVCFRKALHRQFHSCLEPSVCPTTLPLWSEICFQLQPIGIAIHRTFSNRISSDHGEEALSWLAGISGYANGTAVPREPSHLWPSLSSLCTSRFYILLWPLTFPPP